MNQSLNHSFVQFIQLFNHSFNPSFIHSICKIWDSKTCSCMCPSRDRCSNDESWDESRCKCRRRCDCENGIYGTYNGYLGCRWKRSNSSKKGSPPKNVDSRSQNDRVMLNLTIGPQKHTHFERMWDFLSDIGIR